MFWENAVFRFFKPEFDILKNPYKYAPTGVPNTKSRRKEKMNNKTKTIVLSILLVVSMLIVAAPYAANAQVIARDITLNIAAEPNPVGIGQPVNILCWSDIYPNVYVPQNVTNPAGGPNLVGAITYARFHNFTFTITHPDGSIETRVFPITDPLGSAYFTYTPNQLGTYTVVCKYPGESFANGVQDPGSPIFRANASFNPATSKAISFVVQSTAIPSWTEQPIPTDYWTRPIDASNRFWGSIGGSWLTFTQGQSYYGYNYWTNFAPYTKAPNTAHILWLKQFQDGGLVGGEGGVNDYYTGESYQMKFAPIVMDGRLYYNNRVGSAVARGYTAVDLRTGEVLFTRNDTNLVGGFQFSLQWEDAHGTIDYLVGNPVTGTTGLGTTMNFYDPLNGERCFTIENITLGGGATIMNNTAGAGMTSDMNIFYLTNGYLVDWSFFKTVAPTSGFSWAPSPTVNYNWAKGIVYNVSIPKPADANNYAISTSGGLTDGKIIVARTVNTTYWPPVLYLEGIRCTDGQILWTSRTQLLNDPGIWRGGGGVALDSNDGVYLNYKKETMQVIGFDLATGNVKYTTDPRDGTDWGVFTGGWCMDTAYGKFYIGAYDGLMIAYDAQTGKKLWEYSSGNAGLETPYGTWPFFMGIPYGMTIADGKVFAATGEHSPNDPLYRGEQIHVIDVNTGLKVWSLQGWWLGNAMADGSWTAYNGYDGRIYNFYKGPTMTTVTAPTTTVPTGQAVLIQGTILDESPAQPGTPCVSADSMTAWMQYLHMQDPLPTNTTGVPVKLEAFGADGSVVEIGTFTSDTLGYRATWTPDKPGVYTILASFAGDESYGSSHGSTSVSVGPAQSGAPSANDIASAVASQLPVQTPVPTAPSASDVASAVVAKLPSAPVFTSAEIAIIAIVVIALIIGLVNLALLMRKKQ